MRILYVLHGVAGSGKSTFIKNNNLEGYTLSTDLLRRMVGASFNSEEGFEILSQQDNFFVWKLLFQLLEQRMRNHSLTFIDATNCRNKDFENYKELSDKYNYKMVIINFDLSLDECLKRNRERNPSELLTEERIEKFYAQKKSCDLSKYNVILPSDIQGELNYETKDFSSYEKIVFIGDLQGCYSSLNEYFINHPMNEKYLYIFVGDYIDRGIENDLVIKFLLNIFKKTNVILMKGNHELHLENWTNDREVKSSIFNQKTLPQIMNANLNKNSIKELCSSFVDFIRFNYHDKEFTVTHAGLPFYPKSSDVKKNNIASLY